MSRIYSLKAGAKVPDDLLRIARRDNVGTALVEAIGGVGSLNLAYFNRRAKKYEEHRYDEFMEVTGMVGNITTKDGSPFLHVHGTFGRRDLSVVGGTRLRGDRASYHGGGDNTNYKQGTSTVRRKNRTQRNLQGHLGGQPRKADCASRWSALASCTSVSKFVNSDEAQANAFSSCLTST